MRRILALEEHAAGLSWTLDEPLQRSSHALVADGRVWLVDPVDAGEALARAGELGEPAGVLQLLDRHPRDCAALAARLGVPFLRLPAALPDTPFEVVRVLDVPRWRERGLWWPAAKLLVVAEAVGTAPAFAVGSGPVGVHPFLRLLPPGALRSYAPDALLMGHGTLRDGPGTAAELQAALHASRRDVPRLLARLPALARSMR